MPSSAGNSRLSHPEICADDHCSASFCADAPSSLGMCGQTTRLWTLRQLPGTRISLGGAIRAASSVPLEFPTYRGGYASEPRRDPAYRSTRGNPARNFLTLLQRQCDRRSPKCCWGNASIQSQYAVHAALVPSLERSRNVGSTLTVPPAVPKLGLLLRREPRPCVPLHTHTSHLARLEGVASI